MYHSVTGGKFSCEFGKSTNEPKSFSFIANNLLIAGYIPTATFSSNTLVFDGITYGFDISSRLRLMVHTGATIKPGTYRSSNMEAGLTYYSPSYYSHWVDGSMGDLSVTINTVNDNIVSGFFSGTNYDGKAIANGRFFCRIKNYRPYVDSVNKWQYVNESLGVSFDIVGGNILYAIKKFTGNKYRLSIKGETDLNTESFKLAISSASPIDTGTYLVYNRRDIRWLDTLYIKSSDRLYQDVDGSTTISYTFCHIDKIDDKQVVGTMGEKREGSDQVIRKGSFKASFY
jgi:hypothetical protein